METRYEVQVSTQVSTVPHDGYEIVIRALEGEREFRVPIPVRSSDTISNIKHKYSETQGVRLNGREFFYDGKQLKDDRTLESYGVQAGGVIALTPRLTEYGFIIFAILPDKRLPLMVLGSDTVSALKQKIEEIEGIPSKRQRIAIAGKRLEDERSLSEYSISRDTEVTVEGA